MINIALNLGKVALAISAQEKESGKAHLIAKGAASECYRATANKVFGPKNHSRDEAFSPELASKVEKACNAILSQFCDNIKIETSARKESAPKITVESVLAGLGLEMADLKALAKAKAEKAAEFVGDEIASEEEEQDVIEQ